MTTDNQDSMWITDRRPLPVDALDNGAVRVRLSPESTAYVNMHRANVGLGTPWRHCVGWTFPEIRTGQAWLCEDGEVRVVKQCEPNEWWLIGWYHYTSNGEAPGTLSSTRLAELISEPSPKPKPNQIPPAILSGEEAFYVLVADDDGSGNEGEPFVFETLIAAGDTFKAARDRQAVVGSNYGTTYVAECRIISASARKP